MYSTMEDDDSLISETIWPDDDVFSWMLLNYIDWKQYPETIVW